MAAIKLPGPISALIKKLRAALPFLGSPKKGSVAEDGAEFDSFSDEGFDPPSKQAKAESKRAADSQARSLKKKEALKSFVDAVLGNRLAVGLLLVSLASFLAIAIVAFVVTTPPRSEKKEASASEEGLALLKRFILPESPGIELRVELERELRPMYTAEDVARFRTDSASVDLQDLHARNQAELEALYATVP